MVMEKIELKLFITFFLVFALTADYLNWNENSRIDLTMAIVEEGRVTIDSFYENTGDRAYYEGHYYSDKAPGMSFLAVPSYLVYRAFAGQPEIYPGLVVDNGMGWPKVPRSYLWLVYFLILSTSSLFGALSCVLMYKILQKRTKNRKATIWLTFGFGFGTLMLTYSRLFFGHVTAVFFLLLALYLLDRPVLSGLFAGFSIFVDYTCVIVFLAYFILLPWRSWLIYLAGSIVPLLLLFSYHSIAFDHPLKTGYGYNDQEIWKTGETGYSLLIMNAVSNKEILACDLIDDVYLHDKCVRFVASANNNVSECGNVVDSRNVAYCTAQVLKQPQLCQGLTLKEGYYCGLLSSRSRFAEIWLLIDHELTQPGIFMNIFKVLFSPLKGLFFLSPFLLLGFFSKKDKFYVVTVIIFLAFLIFNATIEWSGGDSFGTRHMLPVVPFLVISAAGRFSKPGKSQRVVSALVITSILLNLMGLAMNFSINGLTAGPATIIPPAIFMMLAIISVLFLRRLWK